MKMEGITGWWVLRAVLALACAAFVVAVVFPPVVMIAGGLGVGFLLYYFVWSVRTEFGTQVDHERTEDRLERRRSRNRRRRAARLAS